MKRIVSLMISIALLLCFCGCGGSFQQVNLKEPIPIPENGVVEKKVFENVKEKNEIAIFTGDSKGLRYEWTIFGSDLLETRDLNLSVTLEKTERGLQVSFGEIKDFNFPALLSVYLDEKWAAQSAIVYDGKEAISSVSITGSKESILNMSVNQIPSQCMIVPDTENFVQSTTVAETNQEDRKQPEKTEFKEGSQPEEIQGIKEASIDAYLSQSKQMDGRVYSDGTAVEKDQYETDPVPEGKPLPVEPQQQEVNTEKTYTCTISIECSTILNHLEDLDPDKRELLPSDGVILAPETVVFYEKESVFDVLRRVCKEKNIHMESSWTPVYNSAYVEGIHNLYEFDCGELSGWMYRVNGWYPNYGCSRYQLADGEKIEFRYTCDLGKDIGCDWMK